MKLRTPAVISVPVIPNTTRNPSDTVAPTSSALANRSASVGVGEAVSAGGVSPSRYQDRYAGSMANPHGLTVATTPR